MTTNPDITTISNLPPEDISMDFERLRTEGISHLESLATQIWTDFNIHDPGITILEVLCYAITDLGYRTNLPIEDLLACPPGSDNPFFLGEEILPVCPITENDFRKLLIDFPGIRNAWVQKSNETEPPLYIEKVERMISYVREDLVDKFLSVNVGTGTENIETLRTCLKEQIFTESGFSKEGISLLRQNGCGDIQSDSDLIQHLASMLEASANFFECAFPYFERGFKTLTDDQIENLLSSYNFSEPTSGRIRTILNKLKEGASPSFTVADGYLLILCGSTPAETREAIRLFENLLCKCSYYRISKTELAGYHLIHLNGLYKICIDTYKNLNPDHKEAKKLIKRIKKHLCQYRNLSEDFHEVAIAGTQDICLCLNIDIDPEFDEKEVMAKIMFQIQTFLTPNVPFYTFQQMLDRGFSCDEICNGPLLNHGFILDQELEAAVIPEKIRLSDLYNIIMAVPGVAVVNELKIKNVGADRYDENWCFEYDDGSEDYCKIKPIIDLCCSSMWVYKSGIGHQIREEDITELIELYQLDQRNLISGASQKTDYPRGAYREDLGEYASIQYEFPHNYALGEEGLPDGATALRRAQVKQLQAYLLFFDRMLANYLSQLGQVKNILSVDQDPEMATYFYQTLYEIPGVRDLIDDYIYTITDEGIALLQNENLPQSILTLLQGVVGTTYTGIVRFRQEMRQLLGSSWRVYRNPIKRVFRNFIGEGAEWEAYTEDDDSFFIRRLRQIVERPATQFQRKHRLLNHLLARFGEQFTDYVGHIFDSRKDHLQAKTDFLRALPGLGRDRAKAYNYCAEIDNHPDVWNTTNVSGLKERVYRLLGLGQATTESVTVNPSYRLIEEIDRTRDLPYKFLKLFRINENSQPVEALLTTTKAYSPKKVKKLKPQLYVLINNEDLYSVKEVSPEEWRVVFSATIGGEEIKLTSVAMSEEEAKRFLDIVIDLIDTQLKGGFHILEHLLLRPNDDGDQLLKMAFSCDLQRCPIEPYSFWISVVLPAWKGRYKDREHQLFFMRLFRMQTPAHIAVCFRWVDEEDTMERFEYAFELWREALAECTPDECSVTTKANNLIEILNTMPCDCYCFDSSDRDSKCACPEEAIGQP